MDENSLYARCEGVRNEAGVTLIEVTIAFSLFAVVLGAAAQSLISHQVTLRTLEQRNIAAQHCQSIFSEMRELRDHSDLFVRPAGAPPSATFEFPATIAVTWPDGEEATIPGTLPLPNESITITYVDDADNPLEVIAVCRWTDLRGRDAMFTVSTIMTDV